MCGAGARIAALPQPATSHHQGPVALPTPLRAPVLCAVRNLKLNLGEEEFRLDFYLAFTWRQRTSDPGLIARSQPGSGGALLQGDPGAFWA